MRKVHLLTTVAAGLLLATAASAAENSDQKSKSEMSNPAPAAQQAAPAEKVAPSMKAGERKTPETTGQAIKSDDKSKPDLKASDGGKAGMKAEEKKNPETTGAVKENTEKSGAAQKSTESTTGQGAAAGSAKLSAEQRSKITTVIKKQNVKPVQLNISVRVGASVPASVHFYPLPQEVVVIYPEWRGYDYILVGDQIVVVDPRSHEIVAILEA